MRRDLGPFLLLAVFLVLFGGFAWLTRHPNAEMLRRAQGWPGVGPWATLFRDRYLPPPDPLPHPGDAATREVVREPVVAPARPPAEALPRLWVVPGVELRTTPVADAPTLLQFEEIANVPVFEEHGGWHRVGWKEHRGWVYLENRSDPGAPPFGRAPEPPLPLAPRPPDAAVLAAARAAFGDTETVTAVGPYTLYTDSRDARLLALLDRVAGRVEEVYTARYGRRPLGRPRAAVVLYADERVYRRVQDASPRLAGLLAAGHSRSGLALLFAGRDASWRVASTLVHEIVHLINRRALGPALPSWLDEGLAEDLAMSRLDAEGALIPGTLGGVERAVGGRIESAGGRAALTRLRRAARGGRLPPIQKVLTAPWEDFVRPDRAELHYAMSAFWVRFLLDGEDGRSAEPFRAFLDAVAAGEPPDPEALRERLGEDWQVLDARYRRWLERTARR